MNFGFLGTFIGFAFIIAIVVIYHILSVNRDRVKKAYSMMNVNLKKRWDIVPNFVEVVKDYSAYEETTLEKLTVLRNQEYNKFQMEQKIEVDNNISKVVSKMISMAEKHPEIKANEAYSNLSNQLVNLESEIKNSKKEYKEAVKKYNTSVEAIPNNVVAILFGFNEETEI